MSYTDIFQDRDPLQLTLLEGQLTYTCNIRCDYCFNPHHRRGDELSTVEWKRVLREGAELGAQVCVFNGGEPVARPDCLEIVSAAHGEGMTTGLSTNGMLLTPALVHDLVSVLDILQISIHPWRYLDDLSGGVREFATHVRRFKADGGRKAVFNIVFNGRLLPKLEELLRVIAGECGDVLDAVGVQAANPYGQGFLNPKSVPSLAECRAADEILARCQAELSLRIDDKVADYFKVKPNTWGRYGVIVNPEGYVYPLIEGGDMLGFLFREMEFDNVRDSSLADIWATSSTLSRFRGDSWHQEPCRSCVFRQECAGGSRLNAYLLAKDIRAADPFCVLSPDHHQVMRFYRDGEPDTMRSVPLTVR